MSESSEEKIEVWTEEDYAAIDSVEPYNSDKRYLTAQQVLERAKQRTLAWQQATEPGLTG